MTSSKKIDVVICSGDFISGVTSWAFRLRKAFLGNSNIRIHVINCLNTTETVGQFDAITPTPELFKTFVSKLNSPVVVPNYFWELFNVCEKLKHQGHALKLIGYCRSDSEKEYYEPLKKVAHLLSHVVAVSPECAEKLSHHLPIDSRIPITILPTGVEVSETLDRTWQTFPIRIAYGGRIDQEQKRVYDLIELVDQLYRQSIEFTLSIAGAGREITALEKRLKAKDPENRVHVIGKKSPGSMPQFWREHDVMISLSAYEGTSNSMLEAMAEGCVPIVSKTQSGTNGIIEYGKNGFIFPIGETKELTGITKMMCPQSISRIGKEAFAKAHNYSIRKYVQEFERILTSLK
ncbi:glycosyltransferase family 4 protein [Puniceicoccaceae bacterium K14]|nr:glycosyltransferase family 4 protein [Puniceicoccaceae bacterium K14]